MKPSRLSSKASWDCFHWSHLSITDNKFSILVLFNSIYTTAVELLFLHSCIWNILFVVTFIYIIDFFHSITAFPYVVTHICQVIRFISISKYFFTLQFYCRLNKEHLLCIIDNLSIAYRYFLFNFFHFLLLLSFRSLHFNRSSFSLLLNHFAFID